MKLIEKLYQCEPMTDDELYSLSEIAATAERALLELGMRFDLAANEAGRIARQCRSYLEARQRK